MEALKQFNKQKYLNIETIRKNGQTVKTPVWFARDGDALLVWTQADSGKAKRIRNNGAVRVVPSDMSGAPLGEWVNAQAVADKSPEALKHVEKLMQKKYGLMFFIYSQLGRMHSGSKRTTIKIQAQA